MAQHQIEHSPSSSKLDVHPELQVVNLDLNTGDTHDKLKRYYELCCQASDVLVTTSCFAVWKKGGSTNQHAKVIPAVPINQFHKVKGIDQASRIFFFDDNINLSLGSGAGAAETKGICNLRDVATNEYVDFSVGNNGFVCDAAFRHTLIHHSSDYRNVLVQANILDAMSNHDYFTSIILKYKKPGEKVIVYMDVNGTILWNDSIMGMGPDELLLGTMQGFTEVRPHKPFDLSWEDKSVLCDTILPLKELLHRLTGDDDKMFHEFWKTDVCRELLNKVVPYAELGWTGKPGSVSDDDFFAVYQDYMAELNRQDKEQGPAACGITESWFRCCSALREGSHAPVINSFGMDTQRVLLRSARDPRRSHHYAINFEMWSDRDSNKFKDMFEAEALPPPMPVPPSPSRGSRSKRMTQVSLASQMRGSVDSPFLGDHSGEVRQNLLEGVHAFEFVLRKPSPEVSLGAEVKHVELGLQIVQILDEGAIIEANQLNSSLRPPENVLKPGDMILQVNSVHHDTRAMIQECKKVNVIFLVLRPPMEPSDHPLPERDESEVMGAKEGIGARTSKFLAPTMRGSRSDKA